MSVNPTATATDGNRGPKPPLKLLLLEDSPDDADLLIRHLQSRGYEVQSVLGHSASTMNEALRQHSFNLVICDYTLPGFDVVSAIEILKARKVDLPFIVVSGVVGERAAVEVMKAGAHDFITKDHLTRLAPAIDREMREAEVRAHRAMDLEKLSHLAAIVDSIGEAVISQNLDGTIATWNAGAENLFGYAEAEAVGKSVLILVPEQLHESALEMRDHVRQGRSVEPTETVRLRKDGSEVHVYLTVSAIKDLAGHVIGYASIAYDITERKKLEQERIRMIEELNHTLSKVKTLSGLLPICASCKKIRDDHGYWQRLETFVHEHSNAEFSHSICPECMVSLYPEYVRPPEPPPQ